MIFSKNIGLNYQSPILLKMLFPVKSMCQYLNWFMDICHIIIIIIIIIIVIIIILLFYYYY